MSYSALSENKKSFILEQFKNMDQFPAMDSDNLALSWINEHENIFFGFINGSFIQKEEIKNVTSKINPEKICDSFTGKYLCDIYVSSDTTLLSYVANNSVQGYETWSSLPASSRSKILYNVAQTIEKYQQLFAVIESVSSGKHTHKVKTKDIPNLIESFNFYAGCALKLEDESKSKTWLPTGPVCVITEEYNNPSLTLSLRVCSLLASGNSVLLLTDVKSSLSSFLLAELCSEAGIPAGVLNVIPIDQDKVESFGVSPIFSKLIYTGSLEKSILFSIFSSVAHMRCEVLIPKRPVVIVYENDDLHSAANGVLEAFFYHDTRSKSGGCKVLIQESIYKDFLEILKEHFSNILVGSNLSKTDLSCIVTEEQYKVLTECIEDAKKLKAKIATVSNAGNENHSYIHLLPMIIDGLQTSFKLVHEELGGPIIVTVPFRTVKESISMFNSDNKGSPVSVWSEKISVAIEVALKLKSGVVWVNSENVIDARTPFNGIYSSGNSIEGGKDAFFSHLSVLPETLSLSKENGAIDTENEYNAWMSSSGQFFKSTSVQGVKDDDIKEYKLFIGGTLKRSDNGVIPLNRNTLIPCGTASDVKNAISSAHAAHPKWEEITGSQIRKIFFIILEQLRKNKTEMITELEKVTRNSPDTCEKEIDDTLNILYYWASQNERYSGPMQEIKKNLIVSQTRNPLGVIGIQCPDEKPLLSFISLVIPAVAFGNTVVALASEMYPTLALKMCEIFISSNVPSGVINVISGNKSHLVPALSKNTDVNAVWFTDVPCKVIFTYCNVTQRVFHCKGIWNDFNEAKSLKFGMESTYTKTVFLPGGEIFAN